MANFYQSRVLLIAFVFIFIGYAEVYAQQLPQINYQGVARKADGSAVSEQSISLRLTIRDGSANGSSVYTETRQRTTNKFGLFTAVIGSSGALSQSGRMAEINWATGNKFLQVEIDPVGGSSFIDMGTSQLQSVPYAIYASSAAPVGVAGGDLGGRYPNPIVTKLQGGAISVTAPTTGQILKWNGTAWTPSNEAAAATGPTGPQGEQGIQGATGLTGPAGLAGTQGPIGLTGVAGPAGAQGLPGAQGPSGLTGAAGLTGAQGLPGAQGPIGLTGATGPMGAQGLPGVQGPIGLTGPQGLQGVQGIPGLSNLNSIGGISAASDHNGMTLNDGVLKLTPADATNGGVITTGAQTISGAKTFNGSTTFTGTVTGVTAMMVGLGSVDNTSDLAKPISTVTQAALDAKGSAADLALKAPLASPVFTGTVTGVTATMVGLGNVDNTSDLNKPISTATQAALNVKGSAIDLALKAPLVSPTFTGTVTGVTATMVGLGNVDNISDANKPVSSATQAALDLKVNVADLALKAPLTSPAFTGMVTGVTATMVGLGNVDNTSDLNKPVSTAIQAALDAKGSATDLALKAPLASPAFTGTVTGVTATMVGLGNVDNTSDLAKPISTATQAALDAKGNAADLALKAPLASPTFTGTVTGVTATMVGLGNVNNTSDVNKPVSTATQAALDAKGSATDLALKAPLASPAFTGTVTGISATMVGLGNVDNTSDLNKPISTATQTALDTKGSTADLALKAPLASPAFTGTVTGVTATMVGLGNVDNTSDLAKSISTATQSALDLKGSAVDLALKAPLASPAFTGTVTGVTATMVGLGNVDNTSDANKPVSTATQAALDVKGSVADLALKAPLASPAFTGTVTGVTAAMVGLDQVNNTSDLAKPISTATQAALDAKGSAADLALKAPLASPAFTGTVTGVTATMVGLGNVNNTSDLAKPVSTATQAALDTKGSAADLTLKAPLASPAFTGTVTGVTATMVGLSNVDNTSDLAKPISTATQAALDAKGSAADLALKAPLASPAFTGTVTGVTATMVGLGNVDNTSDLAKPISTATQAALDTKGSAADLALKAPLASPAFTGTITGVTAMMVGLGSVDNTSDLNKPVSTATQTALDAKGSAADLALKAPLASPAFTGTVTGVTAAMVGLDQVNNTSDLAKPISTATQVALDTKGSATDLALKAPLASPAFTGTVTGVTASMVGLDQVNNTSDLAKPISTVTQAALDAKGSTSDLALKAPLASPAFTGTVTGVTASMVGLGNVDNTSDLAKPVSTATQAALDTKGSAADLTLKAPLASPAFTGTVTGVTASMVGLGNVDNTSDANKPVSTATQAALDVKGSAADLALKAPLASPVFTGTVTGVTATMVGLGNVDNTSDLAKPIGTATQAALDAKGSTSDLALKAPLASPAFTGTVTGVTATMVGLGNVNNTSDLAKPISTATQAALDTKGSVTDLALKAPLASPAFTGTVTGVTATMVGLGNVDNTSDLNKPVSTATQTALDTKGSTADLALKAPLASPAFTGTVTGVTATMVGLGNVDNTSDLAKPIGTATQTALDAKGSAADLALKAPLASPAFTGTVTGISATMVGLGNVDNTSDLAKPVSTATQAALDTKGSAADLTLKAPLASPAFTGTVTGVTATMVGLGNVDNTSDANKPVSTATQAALDVKGSAADLALKAPLASPAFTGTVTGVTASMVGLDQVNNTSDLAKPISTATQAALDTKGSATDLALKAPLASPAFTGTVTGISATMVGLGNVNNTSDLAKPISTATQVALDTKGSATDLALKAPLASPAFTGTVTGISATMVGLGNVDNTSDLNKPVSTATQTALDTKGSTADLALKAPLASPAFTGTVTGVTATMVGLGNVDNTSDLAKPIGTATQTALDAKGSAADLALKAPLASPAFTGTVTGISATMVGLGNVDNTSDLNKPVSTATQAALDAKGSAADLALKAPLASPAFTGTVTGVTATMVGLGNVDNTSDANKPVSAATQAVLDTKGSAADLALKAPLASPAFTGTVTGISATMVGLGNVDNTSDLNKPVSTATQTALETKGSTADLALKAPLASPAFTGTVTGVTAAMVGLDQVNNTSDLAKPISTATQAALDAKGSSADLTLKAPLASPAFTGTVTGVTATMVGLGNVNNTSDLNKPVSTATQAALDAKGSAAGLALKAPLASPAFTGTVTGVTAAMVGLDQVNNTSDLAKPISTATQAALDTKGSSADLALKAPLASPAFTGTVTGITAVMVGLGNVDDTRDLIKPISTATQTALDTKEPLITAGTSAQYLKGDKTLGTLNKVAVGLDQVDNTSDLAKPISTATQLVLDAKGSAADLALKASLASPTFTGVVTLPAGTVGVTQIAGNNSVSLATTAYADAAVTTSAAGKQNTLTNSAGLAGALSDETGTGLTVFATSPTLVTPNLGTPTTLVGTNITGTAAGLTAGNVTTNANLTGEVTSTGNATTISNSAVISKVLTGYTSGAGTIAATDNILQAIQKLNGNDALKANIAAPTFTTSATAPIFISTVTTGTAPFTVASTTPVANLSIGGNAATATIAGTVTTNANLTGEVTSSGNATTISNSAVIGKVLTGYTSGAGAIAATDNILQAIQKLNGNDALKAPLASPTFTGVVTSPTLELSATSNQIELQSAGVTGTLSWTPTTSNKVITLPNVTGNAEVFEATTTMGTTSQTITPDGTSIYTMTPSASATLTFSGTSAAIGSRVYLYFTATTTSKTITFAGNCKKLTTLATGTTSGRTFIVCFIFDGTNWIEFSRTAALQ
jgi:hypothetical protein